VSARYGVGIDGEAGAFGDRARSMIADVATLDTSPRRWIVGGLQPPRPAGVSRAG